MGRRNVGRVGGRGTGGPLPRILHSSYVDWLGYRYSGRGLSRFPLPRRIYGVGYSVVRSRSHSPCSSAVRFGVYDYRSTSNPYGGYRCSSGSSSGFSTRGIFGSSDGSRSVSCSSRAQMFSGPLVRVPASSPVCSSASTVVSGGRPEEKTSSGGPSGNYVSTFSMFCGSSSEGKKCRIGADSTSPVPVSASRSPVKLPGTVCSKLSTVVSGDVSGKNPSSGDLGKRYVSKLSVFCGSSGGSREGVTCAGPTSPVPVGASRSSVQLPGVVCSSTSDFIPGDDAKRSFCYSHLAFSCRSNRGGSKGRGSSPCHTSYSLDTSGKGSSGKSCSGSFTSRLGVGLKPNKGDSIFISRLKVFLSPFIPEKPKRARKVIKLRKGGSGDKGTQRSSLRVLLQQNSAGQRGNEGGFTTAHAKRVFIR